MAVLPWQLSTFLALLTATKLYVNKKKGNAFLCFYGNNCVTLHVHGTSCFWWQCGWVYGWWCSDRTQCDYSNSPKPWTSWLRWEATSFLFLNINQLDALNFIISFISSLYMFRAHVLIVRRAELYYTVSGIITPICGCPVHRLREDSVNIFVY